MEKPTQTEAMRAALTELGMGANNRELSEWIRAKYDMDMSVNLAQVKSKVKKMLEMPATGEDRPTSYRPTPEPARPVQQSSPSPSTNGHSSAVKIEDVKALSEMLKAYGKDGIADIVQLLEDVKG